MGSLFGSGQDSLSGCRGELGYSLPGEFTRLSARSPSYSGEHDLGKGWDRGVIRAIPPAVQTASRRVRTITTVQPGLNSRKATDYAGKDRGRLQPGPGVLFRSEP